MPQMIIANRLIDGRVVFLAPDEGWNTAIDQGSVVDDETEAQRLLEVAKQAVARCLVIDPTLIEVRVENGNVRPVEIREVIRAFGPTVRTDLGDAGLSIAGIARETDRRAEGAARVNRNAKE
jgi:hypothetical protein